MVWSSLMEEVSVAAECWRGWRCIDCALDLPLIYSHGSNPQGMLLLPFTANSFQNRVILDIKLCRVKETADILISLRKVQGSYIKKQGQAQRPLQINQLIFFQGSEHSRNSSDWSVTEAESSPNVRQQHKLFLKWVCWQWDGCQVIVGNAVLQLGRKLTVMTSIQLAQD